MRVKFGFCAALLGLLVWTAPRGESQGPPPAAGGQAQGAPGARGGPPGGGGARRGGGGFVPGLTRPAGDPAEIARGKTLYEIGCRGCHGADLRGGDMGGPNLLRSQLSLSDKEGELIIPVIQQGREGRMPPSNLKPDDAKAVATYVRSVLATIGRQGMPPGIGQAAPSILVGDAKAGQAYFDQKCAKCHSATGDLKGIATRVSDPKALQNLWVAGRARGFRGVGGGARAGAPVTVTISPRSGAKIEGRLVRIDDFMVTVELADGSTRTIRREGDVPLVEVNDPLQGHRDLLPVYTDKDMHNVTAFLVTLK